MYEAVTTIVGILLIDLKIREMNKLNAIKHTTQDTVDGKSDSMEKKVKYQSLPHPSKLTSIRILNR